MRVEKSRTTGRSPIGFRDALGDRRPAGRTTRPAPPPAGPCRGAARCSLRSLAQRVQLGEPPLVARAPRGDAVAQPVLLHRDLAAELVLLALLLLQHRVAPGLECRETLVQRAGDAAVEPDGGARDALEQPAVMADQHDAGAHPGQLALQPLDAGQVEMVGRLVEQQDVGRGRQRAGQRGAARLAAGQGGGVFLAGQAELLRADTARGGDRPSARRQAPPRHRPAWWRSRTDPVPAADSGWWRRAGRSGRPASGCTSPAAMRSRVDLPEPLRPTRQTRSPAATASSAPDSSGAVPKVRLMSCSRSNGGGMRAVSRLKFARRAIRDSRLQRGRRVKGPECSPARTGMTTRSTSLCDNLRSRVACEVRQTFQLPEFGRSK